MNARVSVILLFTPSLLAKKTWSSPGSQIGACEGKRCIWYFVHRPRTYLVGEGEIITLSYKRDRGIRSQDIKKSFIPNLKKRDRRVSWIKCCRDVSEWAIVSYDCQTGHIHKLWSKAEHDVERSWKKKSTHDSLRRKFVRLDINSWQCHSDDKQRRETHTCRACKKEKGFNYKLPVMNDFNLFKSPEEAFPMEAFFSIGYPCKFSLPTYF